MARNGTSNRQKGMTREQRRQSSQRLVFSIIAIIIIVSWILALLVKM